VRPLVPEAPADLAGVRAGNLDQQGERQLPAAPGRVPLPRRQLDVTEAQPRARLALRGTEQPVHLQCLLVVRRGLLVLRQLAVGVADAVVRIGDAGAAARLLVHLQRAAAVPQRRVGLAEVGENPAHRVLRVRDRRVVVERAAQPQRLHRVVERLVVAVLLAEQHAETVTHAAQAGPVAELGEELERLPQVLLGPAVVAQVAARLAEFAVHVTECLAVTEPARRQQGGALRGEDLVHPAAPVEQRRPAPGELPAVLVVVLRRGLVDGVMQRAVLHAEPGERGVVGAGTGELLGRHAVKRRRQPHLVARRVQTDRGRVRGPQVMVEQPPDGQVALGLAQRGRGELGRVGAQQVVAAEPARRFLGEQRGPGQLGQRGPRLG
jgi:hypothetical protein